MLCRVSASRKRPTPRCPSRAPWVSKSFTTLGRPRADAMISGESPSELVALTLAPSLSSSAAAAAMALSCTLARIISMSMHMSYTGDARSTRQGCQRAQSFLTLAAVRSL
eukprot:scaffold97273_cov67-Phaeocystis_antarctica.AAC.1